MRLARLLRHALAISLLILRKKPTVLQYITLVPAFAIKLVSFLPDVAERERKAFSKVFRSSLHDMYCQSEMKFAFSLHDTTIKFHTDLPNFIPIQNRNDLCGKGNVVSASSKPYIEKHNGGSFRMKVIPVSDYQVNGFIMLDSTIE